MKIILQKILRALAKAIIRVQHPRVIGITGSVGKTSTKEAVAVVLRSRFTVRQSEENYNNEFGVPLTVIGCRSGGRNPLRWLWIIAKGMAYAVIPLPYPDILVLELGVDHPGDINYLTEFLPLEVAVMTAIGDQPVHLEFFKSVDHLAKEKLSIYKKQTANNWAIMNLDEPYSAEAITTIKAQTVSVAVNEPADLQATEIEYSTNPRTNKDAKHIAGLRFKILSEGNVVPVFVPGVIGLPSVYAVLFAAAVGKVYGIHLVELSEAIRNYRPAKGRMNILSGMHDSLIIDDSYNASPAAVREALAVLLKIGQTTRRIVCLGNMEELGNQSKRAHTLIGKKIAETKCCDYLITVGDKAKGIAEAALANGLPEGHIRMFNTADEASMYVADMIEPNDVVLVKGSQSARMEKIVKAILAEPDTAEDVLVRQYGKWLTS